MTQAERKKQNAYRLRKRVGVIVLPVPVPEYALVNKLIEDGVLTSGEALDRKRVAYAVAEMVAAYAASEGG